MTDATVSAGGVCFGAAPAHWATDGNARLVPLMWRTMADREKIGRLERFIGSRLGDWWSAPETRGMLVDDTVAGASMYESISGFERICPVAREADDVRKKLVGGLADQPPLPEGDLGEALWDRVVVREVFARILPVYLPNSGRRPTLLPLLTREGLLTTLERLLTTLERRRSRGSWSTTCSRRCSCRRT